MEASAESLLVGRLRDAELPRTRRGYGEEETRRLLAEAATVLEEAVRERDRLRRELQEARETGEDPDAIGKALLTAVAAGEEVVTRANEQARTIVAEAEAAAAHLLAEARERAAEQEREAAERRRQLDAQLEELRVAAERERAAADAERERLLATARVEADDVVAAAAGRVTALEEQATRLRKLVDAEWQAMAALVREALDEVRELENKGGTGTSGDLVTDLVAPARAKR